MKNVTLHDTDQLAALVASKLKLVQLLAQLARRQLNLAECGQLSELLKLLAAKQTVLEQLGLVQQRLDPFRAQDPEARRWPTPEDRLRCQHNARRCDELLTETMRWEKESEAEMVRRRDAAAASLAGSSAAAAARAAYANSTPSIAAALHLHCEG